MKSALFSMGIALGLAGCAGGAYGTDADDGAPVMASATADLRDASGSAMGTATATQAGDAIRIRVDGMNLPAGPSAIPIEIRTDFISPFLLCRLMNEPRAIRFRLRSDQVDGVRPTPCQRKPAFSISSAG